MNAFEKLLHAVSPLRAKIRSQMAWLAGTQLGRTVLIVTPVVAAIWAFWLNDGLQKKLCALPVGGYALSDACGALDLGDRPNRNERMDWKALKKSPGDCDALSAFVANHQEGKLRQRAQNLLDERHVSQNGPFVQKMRPTDFYESKDAPPSPSESAAHAAALSRAQRDAQSACQKKAANLQDVLVSAAPAPQDWTCDRIDGGVVCGFQGEAICKLREPVETCGIAK